MMIREHIILSLVFSVALYPFIGLSNSLIVFLSGVLIDIDHYIQYVIDFKDYSLKKAYRYFIDEIPSDVLQIFHVVEAWVVLLSMAIFIEFLRYVIVGMAFHLILDFIYFRVKNIKGTRATSAIMWVLRRVD